MGRFKGKTAMGKFTRCLHWSDKARYFWKKVFQWRDLCHRATTYILWDIRFKLIAPYLITNISVKQKQRIFFYITKPLTGWTFLPKKNLIFVQFFPQFWFPTLSFFALWNLHKILEEIAKNSIIHRNHMHMIGFLRKTVCLLLFKKESN